MEYKVIDDFLPKNDLVHLQNELLRSNFSWYYLDTVATLTDPDKSHYYFVNCLYDKGLPVSPSFDHLINPIIESLKKNGIYLKALLRLKANMYPSTHELVQHDFHTDLPFEHQGLILSLNTCDGATVLEDGTKIDSVANRCLLFDSSKKHASTTCTDQNVRVNINMNFL